MRRIAALLLAALSQAGYAAPVAPEFVTIPAGEFKSALRYEDAAGPVRMREFRLMRTPVTNAQFLAFVREHAEWQRGRAPVALAEARYLSRWAAPLDPGASALPDQPVTWVSWFAAHSYCEARGARLPTWLEWEYAASADATRRDARGDPAWREAILEWYASPSNDALPRVGQNPANVYGVQDLHGLVWEWIDDASALLVSSDNREQGAADKLRFCGASALSADDRENYAILMRVAMLSSLEAADATGNMGFRCAQDVP
jgi:formylglycine-generating enzyme required for sulfatase activity